MQYHLRFGVIKRSSLNGKCVFGGTINNYFNGIFILHFLTNYLDKLSNLT